MSQPRNELVIVSGASSGIGEAISILLLESGYDVLGIARDFSKCGIDHSQFHAMTLDLTDLKELEIQIKQFFADPQSNNFQRKVRALVANAGVGKMGYLEQLSVEDMQQTMNTNFLSHAVLAKLLLPDMKSNDSIADIIFIGSESALQGERQGTIYCASKFALRGFAQALRAECGKSGVRVGIINPGAVRTPFFNDLHFQPGAASDNAILPADVAQAVLGLIKTRVGTVIDEINLSPMNRVWEKQ